MSDPAKDACAAFESVDIYLLDQILRGRFAARHRVLDVGCGSGRNLRWFLSAGLEVTAIDRDAGAVERARRRVRDRAGEQAAARVQVADARDMPFADSSFDAVLVNAVLHFVADEGEFDAIVAECGRVLAPGGLFFARLCSSIGLEDRVRYREGRRADLPDGTRRFLVDRAKLDSATAALGATLADPVKTTLVEDLRAMTTWCAVKEG